VRFRSTPFVALMLLLTLSGAMGSWHAQDDYDGDAAFLAHDHTAHHERFTAPARQSAPEHCAFCHWLRAFGTGAPAALQRLTVAPASVVTRATAVTRVRMLARLSLPSRAPPRA
jgi:hypothetical protein